ncbi:MAG: hypothetical protein ACO1QB_18275 [Verrucomicrobiales bacterium]
MKKLVMLFAVAGLLTACSPSGGDAGTTSGSTSGTGAATSGSTAGSTAGSTDTNSAAADTNAPAAQ